MIDNKTQELPDIHFSQSTSVTVFITFITISFIFLGLLIGYLSVNSNKRSQLTTIIPANPTAILTQLTPTIAPTSELFPDYRVLKAPELGFSIHYPSNIIPEVQSNLGPTESGGVIFKFEGGTKENDEMGIPFSDGYIISVFNLPTSDPLHDHLSFEEVVNKEIDSTQAYDHIIKPQNKVTFAGMSGVQFVSIRVIHKQEITTHYILQAKNGRILEIDYMFLDPTNKGYKKTVEQMLSTFKLTE